MAKLVELAPGLMVNPEEVVGVRVTGYDHGLQKNDFYVEMSTGTRHKLTGNFQETCRKLNGETDENAG